MGPCFAPPPRFKAENEVRIWEGWIWLQQGAKDLRNTSQRILVKADSFVDHEEVQAACNVISIVSQPFEAEGLSPRLDLTVAKARGVMATWPRDLQGLDTWVDEFAELIEDWEEDFKEAREGLDGKSKTSWDQWQTEALAGSARKMHRLTRLKANWEPTVVECDLGAFSADPRKLLAREADGLFFVWKA